MYDLTINIDRSVQIVGDLTPLIQQINDRDELIRIYEHRYRNYIYKKAYVCEAIGDDWFWRIESQIIGYRNNKHPANAGLFECGVLLRRHTDKNVQTLINAWWGA